MQDFKTYQPTNINYIIKLMNSRIVDTFGYVARNQNA